MKIALVGNPNSGKTTMFNFLTGNLQSVGNWPGVTIEKKEGKLKYDKNIDIIDLPGVYSLSAYTLEEVITREYILEETPDVIINIVDASNLERNLYLSTQLMEIGVPIIIALNMIDVAENKGIVINKDSISDLTGCLTFEISASKGIGIDKLIEEAKKVGKTYIHNIKPPKFSDEVEKAIEKIKNILKDKVSKETLRWYSIKLLEKDTKVLDNIKVSNSEKTEIEYIITKLENKLKENRETILTNERYNSISNITKVSFENKKNKISISDKIDKIVLNKFLAFPIFILVMFSIYYISVTSIGTYVTDWTNDVFFGEYVTNFFESILDLLNTSDWLKSLVLDGIVAGVGAVLGFVPQMFLLFLFLSFLEDCGYMVRIAFIMDRIFRRFGMSGKSFIPIMISSGCGVPGIMASRTIENEKDRKITIMVTTFIPCGAKLPIIALFGAALFPNNIFIGVSIYFLGIIMILISGAILKKTKILSGDYSPFVMELPPYHKPILKNILIHVWEKVKSFIIKAGTVIFIASIVVWLLSNFNFSFKMVDIENSILATIGTILLPIFTPLGFGNWQATVATLNGLIAKEQVVSMFGVLFGVGSQLEGNQGLLTNIASLFSTVSAYSFVAFNMICAPCFAAIGAIRREMGNWKWTLIAIGYQTLVAYIVSFVIFQIGSILFLNTNFNLYTVLAIIALAFAVYLIFRKNNQKHSIN